MLAHVRRLIFAVFATSGFHDTVLSGRAQNGSPHVIVAGKQPNGEQLPDSSFPTASVASVLVPGRLVDDEEQQPDAQSGLSATPLRLQRASEAELPLRKLAGVVSSSAAAPPAGARSVVSAAGAAPPADARSVGSAAAAAPPADSRSLSAGAAPPADSRSLSADSDDSDDNPFSPFIPPEPYRISTSSSRSSFYAVTKLECLSG